MFVSPFQENELFTRDFCFSEQTEMGEKICRGVMSATQKNIFTALKAIEQPGAQIFLLFLNTY